MTAGPLMQTMVIMALTGLAYSMIDTSETFLVEQALCRAFYAANSPNVALLESSVPESMCKMRPIQSKVAVLTGLFNSSMLVIAFLVAPIWTRLASIIGRKNVLVINSVSVALRTCLYTAVFYYYNWFNVHAILALCLLDVIGGGIPVREILLSMYIAENVPEDKLDAFYTLTAVLIGMGSLGTFLGSLILRTNVWLLCTTATAIYTFIIPVACLLPSRSPHLAQSQSGDASAVSSASSSSRLSRRGSDLARDGTGMLRLYRSLFRQILWAITVDLPLTVEMLVQTIQDPLIRRVMAIFYGSTMAMVVHSTVQQWASNNFHWSLASVNTVSSVGQVVSALVLVGLPFLSHGASSPLLRTKARVDLCVVLVSIMLNAAGCLVMAFSPSMLIYGVGLVTTSLGQGLFDSLRSFATSALPNNEMVQRLYMGIRTVQTLGALIGTPLWAGLLSLVLHSDGALPKGLTFLGASSLYFLALYWSLPLRRYVKEEYAYQRMA